jgi:hypothetical protein
MPATPVFRLPGVYFSAAPRPLSLALPPLDVAAFVGFAERGPLDWPVSVEDVAMYRSLFGGDLALARGQDSRLVYAYLPAAVAAFFSNGGRRCYVVRVAGRQATAARCRVPGLVALEAVTAVTAVTAAPRLATLAAGSPGRWGNRLRLATRLLVTPLPADKFQVRAPLRLDWQTDSAPQAVQAGDLLRLTLDDGRQWLFPVSAVERPLAAAPQATLPAAAAWEYLSPTTGASPPPAVLSMQRLGPAGADDFATTAALVADGQQFNLLLSGGDSVQPGEVVQLQLSDGTSALFPVVTVADESPSGGPVRQRATAPALLRLDGAAGGIPFPPTSSPVLRQVERWRFRLAVQLGDEQRFRLDELAFNQNHPRFWGEVALLESNPLHRPLPEITTPDEPAPGRPSSPTTARSPAAQVADWFRTLQADRRPEPGRQGVVEPGLLAGLLAPLDAAAVGATYLPLAMPLAAAEVGGPTVLDPGDDDLARFDADTAALFVDGYLLPLPGNPAQFPNATTLLTSAADRYYVQNRRLKGLHSLLFNDAVALLSVPDTVHRNWQPDVAQTPPTAPSSPVTPVTAGLGEFTGCQPVPTVTAISPASGPVTGGISITVSGTGFPVDGAVTVLFGDLPVRDVQVESATRLHCQLPVASRIGAVAVTVVTAGGSGTRGAGFNYQAATTLPPLPTQGPTRDFDLDDSPLLAVQQALLTICQARADVVTLWTLPAHFEKRHCLDWQDRLRQRLGLPRRGSVFNDVRDLADLSYAAVYHPWLRVAATTADGLRAMPPDGAISGLIAAREHDRQVWVAPANVALPDVLELVPAFTEDDWAELFALQFNLIRPAPDGFRSLSAHTLSDEQGLLQLSVRRLLILLRKLLLARGQDYVFAGNREQFRTAIRRDLEDVLRRLFEQGAFAGATQPAAFRVSADATLNSAPSIEQGRLVVQLQIAPSQPLEFLNVALLRSSDGELQAQEG